MSHKYLLSTCEAQALVQVLEFPESKWGGRVLLSTQHGISWLWREDEAEQAET